MEKLAKHCTSCNRRIRSHSKGDKCQECLSTCQCGASKDYRADSCRTCGSRKQALAQWSDPAKKERIHKAIVDYQKTVRTRFDDLKESSFVNAKAEDGRLWARYWDGDKKRAIYRYQWRWILAHGDIPKGYHIHHKDEICTNDELDNLECLPKFKHLSIHGTSWKGATQLAAARSKRKPSNKPEWICQTCGAVFKMYARGSGEARKHCSRACASKSKIKH